MAESVLRQVLESVPGRGRRGDFAAFCTRHLGEAFNVPFARYQEVVIDIISTRSITEEHIAALAPLIRPERRDYLRPTKHLAGLLDVEPRDHGKTTRMSQALPLWLALTHKDVFVVLVGVNKERAEDWLKTIREEIENNEGIEEEFGDQKGPVWKNNKIKLANGNVIAALGVGQGIRGIKDKYRRPTHVICDDLLKDDEVESKAAREKLYRWIKRVVLNLGKGALIVVVNTIMHPDDLPSRLLDEVKDGRHADWAGLWLAARTPEGDPIWPQRWSSADLEAKRRSLGPYVYATEWDNERIAPEDRKFDPDWFQFYDPKDLAPILRRLKIVMAVDPSTGREQGDYSAVAVCGKDPETGLIYVLETWAERGASEMKLVGEIVRLYAAYKPKEIRFEDVAFQVIYRRVVVKEASRLGLHLPLKGVKPRAPKVVRILSLAPLIENGLLRFRRGGQKLLLSQLENFPKDNDDLPDALEYAVEGLETDFVGGVPVGGRAARLGVIGRLARHIRQGAGI